MDTKQLKGLMEAYAEVYAPQEFDEAITSEKGKAKAAEMIAKRSTASGRAKPGQGASVDRIKHISRANVDGYGGTPANRKVAKNPVKSNFSGLNSGTGNKAARRAAALKKEDFDIFDTVLEFLQAEGFAETLEEAEWMMANVIDEEVIGIILGEAEYKAKTYSPFKDKQDLIDAVKKHRESEAKKSPEQRKSELDAYIKRQKENK